MDFLLLSAVPNSAQLWTVLSLIQRCPRQRSVNKSRQSILWSIDITVFGSVQLHNRVHIGGKSIHIGKQSLLTNIIIACTVYFNIIILLQFDRIHTGRKSTQNVLYSVYTVCIANKSELTNILIPMIVYFNKYMACYSIITKNSIGHQVSWHQLFGFNWTAHGVEQLINVGIARLLHSWSTV